MILEITLGKAGTDMSETSNLASNNIEPSMEDILSSIRKVIAEDLNQKEENEVQPKIKVAPDVEPDIENVGEAVTQAEPQIEIDPIDAIESAVIEQDEIVDDNTAGPQSAALNPVVEVPLEDILELDTLFGDMDEPGSDTGELMEIIQLEDSKESSPVAEEFETLSDTSLTELSDPDSAGSPEASPEQTTNFGFDETLDLVMDADASDYVTQSISPMSSEPQDEQVDAGFEAVEVPKEPVQGAIQFSSNPANTEDDMNLVKSLLDDLMDEPIAEAVSETVETAMATETTVAEATFDIEDAFSEEDLRIPDPKAVTAEATNSEAPSIEERTQAAAPSVGEMDTIIEAGADTIFNDAENTKPEDTEPESEIENELAQLAQELAEIRDAATTDTVPKNDDVIELSTPDYASKLAISASLTGGAALVDDKSGGLIAAEAESDLESLQQLMAETNLEEVAPTTTNSPQEINTLISPVQEDATMATPLKTDILSDADTQQEVSNAFASLTTTVQEHALAEENGPPIGELVKEALRPMLQEWLDKNLKSMVQRAVTKEIKRISSGK